MSPDQKAIILFLHEKGHATAEEIRKGIGLNEGSGVTDLLDALGQAGAIVNSPRHGSLVLSSHGHWLAGELASGVFSSKASKAAPPPSEPSNREPTPSSLGIESAPSHPEKQATHAPSGSLGGSGAGEIDEDGVVHHAGPESPRPSRDPAHISTLVLESLKGMAEKLEEVAQSQARDAEAIRHVMDLVDKESAGDG